MTNVIKWELSRRIIEYYLVNEFILIFNSEAFSKFFTYAPVDIQENNTGQNRLNVRPFSFCCTVPTNPCVSTRTSWYKKGSPIFFKDHGFLKEYFMLKSTSKNYNSHTFHKHPKGRCIKREYLKLFDERYHF